MEDKIKNHSYKKMNPRSAAILLLGPILITGFLFATRFSEGFFIEEKPNIIVGASNINIDAAGHCSAMPNNTICCDRTNYHSDVCFMRGDVRTHPSSSSVLLLPPNAGNPSSSVAERIRPYTRKWEPAVMNRIPELKLEIVDPSRSPPRPQCDVRHNVTALFFSLGGYTGNVFHAFNNGLVPLYITSQHLGRQVVFVVLEYRHWWHTKYQEILSQLSDYPLVDFNNDTRTHCFPDAIVGLRFHDTLAIDPSRTKDSKTIVDFHDMLDQAYSRQNARKGGGSRPKLAIVARKGTREMENEGEVVDSAREVGFDVEVLRPHNTMQMSAIYRSLSSCDVMMGVHGAALTHFLFMRPGSVFIQVVPVGVDELAQLCFGEAADKLGIRYEGYRILPVESSLYRKHGEGDPIVRDPASVKERGGWEVTKRVYLEGQNVTLDIGRLRPRLKHAFQYAILQRRYQA